MVDSGGTIGLGGATLNVSLVDGFTPSVGDSFTIINNETGNAVGGTFDGLSQGATFNVDGNVFQISYDGGSSGQDVTITEMPCYCPGTLIATEHGEIPVEELAIGDKVITKSGESAANQMDRAAELRRPLYPRPQGHSAGLHQGRRARRQRAKA